VKRVRFVAAGLYHEGADVGGGELIDESGRSHRDDDVVFLPPVVPRSVIAIALNYAEHAKEFDLATPEDPALFFKPPNTWVGHRAPVVYPDGAEYMHYEVELGVVVGRRCRRIKESDAMSCVKGYTIANDLVVRDFVGNFYRPPVKAKGWDTFCPLGPAVVVDEIGDPHALTMRASVNGELRQEGSTSDMIRSIPELIEYITEFMTLDEDDIILTGTPKGISHVYPGDVMRLEIDGIGALENRVVTESEIEGGAAQWRTTARK
jgi:5-oxopent-3-ene-1,2,5-tricarboxylate decarboxylase / 2-hydroxyhepta-2,4-diene-1,7-dioate isomerase